MANIGFYGKKENVSDVKKTLRKKSGERGIRTPGGITLVGFQDRCIKPLCHLSLRFCSRRKSKVNNRVCKFF